MKKTPLSLLKDFTRIFGWGKRRKKITENPQAKSSLLRKKRSYQDFQQPLLLLPIYI